MTFEGFLKNFGNNLAQARQSIPITQKKIAESLGISYRYYQNIEAGLANVTLSTLFKISKFLELTPGELISVSSKKTQTAKTR